MTVVEEISQKEEKPEEFEKIEDIVDVKKDKSVDNNLTISTKLSTDQLICKTPKESPNTSVKSLTKNEILEKCSNFAKQKCSAVLYLGALQTLWGFLMIIFGILVIVHKSSLSQIGGGIWGGCLAITTGLAGVLASAKQWCPLKETAQRVAHTVFLALSLVSLAVAQLVLVLAATGLGRDLSVVRANTEEVLAQQVENHKATAREETVYTNSLPSNYLAVLSNIGLVVVSALECICAAISSYREARKLCPCFRNDAEEERLKCEPQINDTRNAFVSSWLGKHNPPQLYIVAAPPPSSLSSKRSRLSMTPVFAIPPQMLPPPPVMGYPLIPAPLGTVPSPIIRPHPKEMVCKRLRKYPKKHHVSKKNTKRHSKSKSRERTITTEDVAKTYTGLDRTIAEEFIEICDSRNTSLCSDSSCQSSCCQSSCQGSTCQCQSSCTVCTTGCATTSTDVVSREFNKS